MISQQCSAIPQQFHHDWVRREHILAFVFRQAFQIDAAIVERRINFDSIFLPSHKVIRAMSRSGVHDSAALIQCDVIRENARHLNREERMLKLHRPQIPVP